MKRRPFPKIILLIFICLLLNIGLPSLIFGVNIIPGSDEIKLFDKGKAISTGDTDIYHAWDQQELIDPYPPGYSIIVAELLTMIPSIDPFGVSIILRVCMLSLMLLLYFWIGTFISKKTAYLAVFFRTVLFVILVSNPGNYVYIFPTAVFIGGGIFTEICILMTLIFMIRFFYHLGSDRINLSVIFSVGILHGLTHISGFITFTIFMIILLLLFQIPLIINSKELHRWSIGSILSMFARSRLLKPAFVLMLQPLIIYLMFYSTILSEASPDLYKLEKILPIEISVAAYFILMFIAFIIGALALVFGRKGLSADVGRIWPMPFFIRARTKAVLLLVYMFFYIVMIVASNLNPSQFAFSSFAITAVFPAVFPSLAMVPILSFSLGMLLFLLTSYGLYKMIDSNQMIRRYIAFLYLGSYYYFSLLFLFGWISPDRAMFFTILIPLLIGGSLATFSSDVANIPFRLFSRGHRATARHARTVAILIIIGFLIVAVVSRANSDPAIRPDVQSNPSVLSFGSLTPPFVTNDLLEELIRNWSVPGQAILSTPETQTALYAFLDMNPLCPAYNVMTYLPGNMNFHEMYAALYYAGTVTPSYWLNLNHGTLVVLGYLDMNGGPRSLANLVPPVDKMMNDPSLHRVWNNSYGEAIFQLV